jgi:hypothetical protein
VLEGIESAVCPECARRFDPADPGTFSTKAPFVGWIFWLPAFALAVAGGLVTIAVLVFGMGQWGWAVWVAVPFAAGSVLGYRYRSQWFILPLLGLAMIAMLTFGLMTLQLAGVFCGIALAGVFLGPTLAGLILGALLRFLLKHSAFPQRSHLPVLFLFLLPYGVAAVERAVKRVPAVESVVTSRRLDADPASCFASLLFYEDVTHEPPWILRVGLARPLHATGSIGSVGDVRTCVYNKGRLVKRVTDVQVGRLLAFEVIEQSIGYERDVRLRGGSFAFEPAEGGGTLVTLTTTYEALLVPRWCWRPFERLAAHTMHGYVLEGIDHETGRTGEPGAIAAKGVGHAPGD